MPRPAPVALLLEPRADGAGGLRADVAEEAEPKLEARHQPAVIAAEAVGHPVGVVERQVDGELIERHWDGIAAYCNDENRVSLGIVEGLNNKIKVLQRRAYGYRDEDYLKLKIVAAFLPPLPRNASKGPL